jgi:hypothetical protein
MEKQESGVRSQNSEFENDLLRVQVLLFQQHLFNKFQIDCSHILLKTKVDAKAIGYIIILTPDS